MLVNVGPILIALLAGLFLREGFPAGLLAGCVVGFAGTAIIAVATSQHGVAAGWGAGLCIVAAFAYAAAVIVQKPVVGRVSAFQVTWIACTVATIACLPFAPALVHDLADASGTSIAWTVYLGSVPDGGRVRPLGVRAQANDRRPPRLADLSGAAGRDPARLGASWTRRRPASRWSVERSVSAASSSRAANRWWRSATKSWRCNAPAFARLGRYANAAVLSPSYCGSRRGMLPRPLLSRPHSAARLHAHRRTVLLTDASSSTVAASRSTRSPATRGARASAPVRARRPGRRTS